MLKNTIIMLTASLPILAAADEASDSGQYCCPLLPPEPVESCQLPVGYFYPAQYAIRNCGVDLTVAGEFLYWEINEDDIESVGTKLSGTFAGDPNTLVALTDCYGWTIGTPFIDIGGPFWQGSQSQLSNRQVFK